MMEDNGNGEGNKIHNADYWLRANINTDFVTYVSVDQELAHVVC